MTRPTYLLVAAMLAVALGLGSWLLSSKENPPTPEHALPTATPSITLTVSPASPDTSPESASPAATTPAQEETATSDDVLDRVDVVADHDHLGEELVGEGEPAVPADENQATRYEDYEAQAVAFVTAYARPDVDDKDQWWLNVEPFLSAQARVLYRDVDPGMVPFTHVTGEATIMPTEAPEHLLVPVHVPTDAGVWLVEFGTDELGTHVLGISRVN